MATIQEYETRAGETLYMVRYRQPNKKTSMKRGFTTKRDAKAFAATIEVDKMTGNYVAPRLGRVTVNELAPDWLSRKQQAVAPSYYYTIASAWRVHVQPKWGAAAAVDVDQLAVEGWVATLTRGGASTSLITRCVAVLSRILDDAVKGKRLAVNPAKGIENRPRKSGKRHVYLTAGDVHRLAAEAGEHGVLIYLLSYTGLRWGEAAALRVRDVEFLRRRLSIHSNAVEVAGRHVLGATKGREARSVPVPQFVLDQLSVQCMNKTAGDLVFPGRDGGYMRRSDSGSGWFTMAVKRAGIQSITPHDLRHTCASLAVSSGANVKILQRMLGHRSAALTLDTYADLFDDDLDAVAAALDAKYSPENALTARSRRAHDTT